MYDKAVMGKINAEKARKYGIFQQVIGIQKAVQGVSQGNKTPRDAREISPGFGQMPPPVSACALMVWWGDRYGLVPIRAWPCGSIPQMLYTFDTSSCSSLDSSGIMVGIRLAIILLPLPGGPM